MVDMLLTHYINNERRLFTFHTHINVLSENAGKHEKRNTYVTDMVLHTMHNNSLTYTWQAKSTCYNVGNTSGLY